MVLRIVLESLEGDADLFLNYLLGYQELKETFSSMNPGPGFDVINLGPETIPFIRGAQLGLELESWAEETKLFRLRVWSSS